MNFGKLQTTKVGRNLLAKAQLGATLEFTKIVLGNGNLGAQNPLLLTALISPLHALVIESFRNLGDGTASLGVSFSNDQIETGFYFRELGLYANDPNIGEILYCYGNAGALAEYIASNSSGEIIEKKINIVSVITDVANVQLSMNESLIYSSKNHVHDGVDEVKISAENVVFVDGSGKLSSTDVNGAVLEVVQLQEDGEDKITKDINNHLDSEMPHKFTNDGSTYKWGLTVVNGILTMRYEEVI